ncbi:MAG TPA: IclR family transcriptional regulator [Amycolatopsis sp.]|nr:IclR family transcriptional regulator [Amycolatopsis sp.]
MRLVAKSVEILDRLAASGEATVAQLAELTGEPRSSLYRLLASLEHLEFVEAGSQRGTYRLGLHILRLSGALLDSLDERARAFPVMERIHHETGLTIFLFLRRDDRAVCVERIAGRVVSLMAVELGGSLPLHAGASPRVLLALSEPDLFEAYKKTADWQVFTKQTPTTAARLTKLVQEVRRTGVSVSDGDLVNGVAAVGAPIYNHTGRLVASLSASGLREEILDPDSRVIDVVTEGAREVSLALGYVTGDATRNAVGR